MLQLASPEAEAAVKTFRDLIQQAFRDGPRCGRPATFTPDQLCQLVAVTCEAPTDRGRIRPAQ